MKRIQSFDEYLYEKINHESSSKRIIESEDPQTNIKEIEISFDIDWNKNIGKVKQKITLAMSPTSLGMYELAKDIEKSTGLPKKDAEKYKETPEDAFVYGMCNAMNDGKDIFFWTNGTRLGGQAKRIGLIPAIIEQISHECVHLTRLILAKHILENKGNKEWATSSWPTIGDDPKVNLIDEEAFATALGFVVQTISKPFFEMASAYLLELKLNTGFLRIK